MRSKEAAGKRCRPTRLRIRRTWRADPEAMRRLDQRQARRSVSPSQCGAAPPGPFHAMLAHSSAAPNTTIAPRPDADGSVDGGPDARTLMAMRPSSTIERLRILTDVTPETAPR